MKTPTYLPGWQHVATERYNLRDFLAVREPSDSPKFKMYEKKSRKKKRKP